MDGPVRSFLICPLHCVLVDRHHSKTLETYSRRDLVFWDRAGTVSPAISLSKVSRVVSGERMDSMTGALILGILDKFVWVDVFREGHGGG